MRRVYDRWTCFNLIVEELAGADGESCPSILEAEACGPFVRYLRCIIQERMMTFRGQEHPDNQSGSARFIEWVYEYQRHCATLPDRNTTPQ